MASSRLRASAVLSSAEGFPAGGAPSGVVEVIAGLAERGGVSGVSSCITASELPAPFVGGALPALAPTLPPLRLDPPASEAGLLLSIFSRSVPPSESLSSETVPFLNRELRLRSSFIFSTASAVRLLLPEAGVAREEAS